MEIEHITTNSLLNYKHNNKKHPATQVNKIVKSIKEFGFRNPVLIDGDNTIIAGHGRLLAARKLDMLTVPCIRIDDLTEDQIRAFRIMDNKSAESEYDFEALSIDFSTLMDNGFDVELTGFDSEEIEGIMGTEEVEEIEADDADTVETDIKEGDIFEIGSHRLMCGDSTDYELVWKQLLQEQKVDMCFTDPPYLMDFTGSVNNDGSKSDNAIHGRIENDNMSRKEGEIFLDKINSVIKSIVKGSYYITFYRLGIGGYYASLDRVGLQVRSLIIWHKPGGTLSNSDYKSMYEPMFYGWVDNHNFYGGNDGWDLWTINKTKKNDLHPTMKPIPLISKAITNSSKSNQSVIDLFGGSGSTMVACEQLSRKCYMMELDPKYCQVIINRMRKTNPDIQIKCINRDIEV